LTLKTTVFKIAGLGEVLWDIFPDDQKLGGAPANFVAHAQRLGAKAYLISSVGKDALGKKTTDLLHQSGIDTSGVQMHSHWPTGQVQVKVNFQGDASYVISENVAWDHLPAGDVQLGIAGQLDAICFGTLAQRSPDSHASILKILNATAPHCLRVFDVNFRKNFFSESIVKRSLQLAHVLKMNEEEFQIIAEMFSLSKDHKMGLRLLIQKFDLRLGVITLGEKGALMADRQQFSYHKPHTPIAVKSTVGAGDAFTAATVMGLLEHKNLDEINAQASKLAAWVCTHMEAVPSL
jgi:fructokinase